MSNTLNVVKVENKNGAEAQQVQFDGVNKPISFNDTEEKIDSTMIGSDLSPEEIAQEIAEDEDEAKIREELSLKRLVATKEAYWAHTDVMNELYPVLGQSLIDFELIPVDGADLYLIPEEKVKLLFDQLDAIAFGEAIGWGWEDKDVIKSLNQFIEDNIESIQAAFGISLETNNQTS